MPPCHEPTANPSRHERRKSASGHIISDLDHASSTSAAALVGSRCKWRSEGCPRRGVAIILNDRGACAPLCARGPGFCYSWEGELASSVSALRRLWPETTEGGQSKELGIQRRDPPHHLCP